VKLVPLGETDAAACVDGVCEVPAQMAPVEVETPPED